MFKKLIAIPLFVLYLVAISGMMVQLHFCGSQLASWQISEKQASCCCDASASEKTPDIRYQGEDDCCQNKSITLKIQDAQQFSHQIHFDFVALQTAVLPIAQDYGIYQTPFVISPTTNCNWANAPPGSWQQIPLYKLYNNFTYYG